ncbi:hypothetical protein L6654_08560 [Bradyrhizobium sp. WYCCWR 13023]|uniref:Uncharacterized protein n=1 Tax=Bradyrhizobium zhengyangense TaxID=2911009 RepID=A0A9X1UFN2_9BRAD|nr:hypothetical protein [Bradyrhizobium zhengyangense]MCG2626672.1 hypothetical protein [Bradyrhizobium zhengyangense]
MIISPLCLLLRFDYLFFTFSPIFTRRRMASERAGASAGLDHHYYNNRRWACLSRWRELVIEQLMTPAPDIRAVMWKKAHLRQTVYFTPAIKPPARA